MKKIIPTILLAVISTAASAQDTPAADTLTVQPIRPIESKTLQGAREASQAEKEYARRLAEERQQQAQINNNLPPVDISSQVVTPATSRFVTPYYYPYFQPALWPLHAGLNVNLSASVFANLGNGYGTGTGFAQDVAVMYVSNLSPKATLAVGGYLNNTTIGGQNYTTAGVNALLAYRFNENWSAYAFVQKTINSDAPAPWVGNYGLYGYSPWGFASRYDTRFMDRIGGGVTYQWGEEKQNVISFNVEIDRLPDRRTDPWRR